MNERDDLWCGYLSQAVEADVDVECGCGCGGGGKNGLGARETRSAIAEKLRSLARYLKQRPAPEGLH